MSALNTHRGKCNRKDLANGICNRIARSVVGATAKRGYRSDLRAEAVARVSALKQAQRLHKEAPAAKPRGKKAQKTAAPATEESS